MVRVIVVRRSTAPATLLISTALLGMWTIYVLLNSAMYSLVLLPVLLLGLYTWLKTVSINNLLRNVASDVELADGSITFRSFSYEPGMLTLASVKGREYISYRRIPNPADLNGFTLIAGLDAGAIVVPTLRVRAGQRKLLVMVFRGGSMPDVERLELQVIAREGGAAISVLRIKQGVIEGRLELRSPRREDRASLELWAKISVQGVDVAISIPLGKVRGSGMEVFRSALTFGEDLIVIADENNISMSKLLKVLGVKPLFVGGMLCGEYGFRLWMEVDKKRYSSERTVVKRSC